MDRRYILLVFLLLSTITVFGQEEEYPILLETDSTWIREFFTIPTRFADSMTLQGHEEAVFPPEWGAVHSPQLWSYKFAWIVTAEKPIDIPTLEDNLEIYFNGLMGVSKNSNDTSKLPTTALLIKTSTIDTIQHFTGKVRTFDNFRSKKMMTLNLLVTQHFCEPKQKSIVVFQFSPKAFDHNIWELLNKVSLREACEKP